MSNECSTPPEAGIDGGQGLPAKAAGRTAVCTIVSKNYLHFARTVMDSVRRVHPEWEQHVLLADELQDEFDPAAERFQVVPVRELDLPNKQQFFYRYNILELNTAVKPWFLEKLFQKEGIDRVIYLDPDIHVYQPMKEVEALLDQGAMMVLTPHLTGELNDGKKPTEHDILKAGCYNLGFLGLRRHPELHSFLHWWQRKLEFDCRVAIAENLFVDQRWMDLAPGLFADVRVLRHQGYNVAYWNLNHRPIAVDGGQWVVKPQQSAVSSQHSAVPLVFFHFSGLNPRAPREFSKHQDRFRLGSFCREELKATRQLVQDYCKTVIGNGLETCRQWRYAFGFLRDGTPIADCMRHFYRSYADVQRHVGDDPFDHEHDYLDEPCDRGEGPRITNLMRFLWESQPALQRSFPDMGGASRFDFAECFVSQISCWESVPDRFVAPVRESLAKAIKSGWFKPSLPGGSVMRPSLVGSLSEGLTRRVFRSLVRFLIIFLPLPRSKNTLRAIYRALRPLGRWLPTRFREGLKAEIQFWMHQRKAGPLSSLRLSARRVGPWLKKLAARLFGKREDLHEVETSTDRLASGEVLHAHQDAPPPGPSALDCGMNIIGYIRSEHGVGESARLCVKAAAEIGLPFRVHDFNIGNQSRTSDDSLRDLMGDQSDHWINVFHINADQMPVARSTLGRKFFKDHYNIGFWHWELPEFPEEWLPAFELVNEVWAPTQFVLESVKARSPRPVIRMPHCIRFRINSRVTRAQLGLPPTGFLFLAMYDMRSIQERKNPEAAIEAFRSAFPNPGEAFLIVKINNAESFPRQVAELRERLATTNNTIILDRTLSRQDVYNLEGLCDCFVSLHRSEGFGLGLAESMFLGKPVIGTNWSGNVDFMNATNSCPVDYELVRLNADYGPYRKGQMWAEPDIDHAAWYMARLLNDSAWGKLIAARGRETIRTDFSPYAVGTRYAQRIAVIRSLHTQSGPDQPLAA